MPPPRPTLIGSTCALGLLCLLLVACRTNGPDTTRSDAAADTAAAPSDASVAPTAPPPAPAPGTARVRAEIQSCTPEAQPARCRIRVAEVLAYGSSTPPLPAGDHAVRLSPSVLNDRDATTLDGTGPRSILLRHAGDRPDFGGADDEERPAWTLQSMEHVE
jgi:hypothetical protein